MCSRKKNNHSFDINSKSSTPSQIDFVTDARENFEQFEYLLTYFPKLNLKFGILFIAVIVLVLCPSASSQRFDIEDFDTDLTEDRSIIPTLNQTGSNYPSNLDVSETASIGELPIAEGVKKNQRKYVKCPKKERKSWCFNKGKCHWIEDLEKPSCRCKKNWEGPRCEEPAIDFTKNIENSNEEIVIVAVVISVVIVAIAVMVGCVCWRRMKRIKKDLELEEVEKAEELLPGNDSKHDSITSIDA